MYNPNDKINGTYGFVIDENGREIQGVTEFTVDLEFEKEEVPQAGVFVKGQKVVAATLSGSMTVDKLDSTLQSKIAENPMAKYNFIGRLKDPTSRGEESVMLIGVSFDGTQIIGFTVGELLDFDLDFTVDDYKYLKKIV